jgi:serine/threonine protein kinase
MKTCPVCDKQYPDDAEVCEHDGITLRKSSLKEDPLLGQTVRGKYRVVKKLGSGGMGSVYLAEQMSIGRKIALKVLQGEFANDDEFIKRFHQEARLAANLNHRHLVTIHDFDQTDDGAVFIAMEYVEGQNLRDLIRQRSMTLNQAVRIAKQIAEGLSAAHQAGVIHRDIKPENIMIVKATDEVKVMDFGIARLRDVETIARLTQPGVIMGTPAYMAPEQIEGGEVNEKTDIYAFGIVMYEMLSGDTPFKAPTPSALLIKHVTEQPIPLRKLREDVPLILERLVMQALEKMPERRPKQMAEVVDELQKVEESLKGESLKSDLPQTVAVSLKQPGSKGKRLVIGGAVAGLLLLGGIAAYWSLLGSQPLKKISVLDVWVDKNEVEVGENILFKANARSADGRVIEVINGLQWSSSDPSVAEIDSAGNLATKRSGTVKILARVDEILAPAITVTVKESASTRPQAEGEIVSLAVQTNTTRLQVKQRMLLKVKARYSDGTERDVNEGVEWQSSDSEVVRIDPSGDAEAQKEGKATISAQLGSMKAQPVLISVQAIGRSEPKPAPVKTLSNAQNDTSDRSNPPPPPVLPQPEKAQGTPFAPSGNSKSVVSDYIKSEQERRRK